MAGSADDLHLDLLGEPVTGTGDPLPGATLTGPFTCGDLQYLVLTGTGTDRFTAATSNDSALDSGSSGQAKDAGLAADGGERADASAARAAGAPSRDAWMQANISPLVAAPGDSGVFSAGFGSLGGEPCQPPPGLFVRTWRWSGVNGLAPTLAAALAADDLAEVVVLAVSAEEVACPQVACGY